MKLAARTRSISIDLGDCEQKIYIIYRYFAVYLISLVPLVCHENEVDIIFVFTVLLAVCNADRLLIDGPVRLPNTSKLYPA